MKKMNPVFAFSKPFESKPLFVSVNNKLDNDELAMEIESLLGDEYEELNENSEHKSDEKKISKIIEEEKFKEENKSVEDKNSKKDFKDKKPSFLPKELLFPKFSFYENKDIKEYESKATNLENKLVEVKENIQSNNTASHISEQHPRNSYENINFFEEFLKKLPAEYQRIKEENKEFKNKIYNLELKLKEEIKSKDINLLLKEEMRIILKEEMKTEKDEIIKEIRRFSGEEIINEIKNNTKEQIENRIITKTEIRNIFIDEIESKIKEYKNFIIEDNKNKEEIKKDIKLIINYKQENVELIRDNKNLEIENLKLKENKKLKETTVKRNKIKITTEKKLIMNEIKDLMKDVLDLKQKTKDLYFYKELKKTILIQKEEFLKSKNYYEKKIKNLIKELKRPKKRKIIEPLDSDIWNVFH